MAPMLLDTAGTLRSAERLPNVEERARYPTSRSGS